MVITQHCLPSGELFEEKNGIVKRALRSVARRGGGRSWDWEWVGMVKWNGPIRSDRSNREKWSTSKGARGPLFRNFSGWTEPIHSVLDRNFRKFWLNGSRPNWFSCRERRPRPSPRAVYSSSSFHSSSVLKVPVTERRMTSLLFSRFSL